MCEWVNALILSEAVKRMSTPGVCTFVHLPSVYDFCGFTKSTLGKWLDCAYEQRPTSTNLWRSGSAGSRAPHRWKLSPLAWLLLQSSWVCASSAE